MKDIVLAIEIQAISGDVPETASTSAEGDFANNKELPEWKQRCIRNYVACVGEAWKGNCYACIRACEGQRDWPFRMCRPRLKKE